MSRLDFVNAVMAIEEGSFTPVQAQKLFFLIDRQLVGRIGEPKFAFEPYDYGPFDKDVYHEIARLEARKYARTFYTPEGLRHYVLTDDGRARGEALLEDMDDELIELIRERIRFVKSLSFTALVSSIYRAFPDTRANSVFQE